MSTERNNESDLAHSRSLLAGTIRVDESLCHVVGAEQRKASLTVIRSSADLGEHLFVEERVVIGRDPKCDLPLQDHRVSRQHASITPLSENRYLIEDLRLYKRHKAQRRNTDFSADVD